LLQPLGLLDDLEAFASFLNALFIDALIHQVAELL
jgi:hypothetical protein